MLHSCFRVFSLTILKPSKLSSEKSSFSSELILSAVPKYILSQISSLLALSNTLVLSRMRTDKIVQIPYLMCRNDYATFVCHCL